MAGLDPAIRTSPRGASRWMAVSSTAMTWRGYATRESRVGSFYCAAQFAKCVKTGTRTDGAKSGVATHTGVETK